MFKKAQRRNMFKKAQRRVRQYLIFLKEKKKVDFAFSSLPLRRPEKYCINRNST